MAPMPLTKSGTLPSPTTFVIPKTPMLGLEEVEPLPVPSSPAMMQEMPSVKMPLGNNTNQPVPAAAASRWQPPSSCPLRRAAMAWAGAGKAGGRTC